MLCTTGFDCPWSMDTLQPFAASLRDYTQQGESTRRRSSYTRDNLVRLHVTRRLVTTVLFCESLRDLDASSTKIDDAGLGAINLVCLNASDNKRICGVDPFPDVVGTRRG